jgi:hypothetical protein
MTFERHAEGRCMPCTATIPHIVEGGKGGNVFGYVTQGRLVFEI